MTYTATRDGLHNVVATVTAIKKVLDYEPSMLEVYPLAWVLLDSYTRSGAASGGINAGAVHGTTSMNYRFAVRIATPIYDSKAAEDELIATAISVADKVDNNPQFSGAITSGLAYSEDGQTGWIMVGGVKCRVVDVFVTAKDKYTF